MVVVENTPKVHNLVVCTLCSCYPWPVLGLPPVWYKSAPYRSRAVIDPRGVLREFGTELPDDVEVRVWDSTAELRYLVLPERPAGTETMTEEELAALVTRDSMIGVAKVDAAAVRRPRMNGVHDMGGMQGMGPVEHEKNEPVFHAAWEGACMRSTRAMRAVGQVEHRCRRHALERHAAGRLSADELLRAMVASGWRAAGRQVRLGDAARRSRAEGRRPGHTKATPALTPATSAALAQPRRLPSSRGSKRSAAVQGAASACAPATSIRPAIRACRATRAARAGVDRPRSRRLLFPDTNAHFHGEKPQHVYSVRFAARELWGEQASPRDSVHLDLWDDYLERA